jgi:hypothetical protein
MPQIYLDRIKGKYGWTGTRYQRLVQDIIAYNTHKVSRAVTKVSDDVFKAQVRKISDPRVKRIVLPVLDDVFPKKDIYIRKAAERGRLITDTLRANIKKSLNDTVREFSKTEPTYVYRRGVKASRINPKLIAAYEKRLAGTFRAYTRKDPRIGFPPNVHAIATTEMRSTVNEVKQAYVDALQKKNPEVKVRKRWIHNPSLSKAEPRRGHQQLNGKTIPMDRRFKVNLYVRAGKRWTLAGTDEMDRPHAQGARPEQVINCNCDIEYIVR